MFTFNSYNAAVKARNEATALLPVPAAPIVEAPKVARYKATTWYMRILEDYAKVATPQQIQHANYLACDDWLGNMEITHVGPSFAELDAALVSLQSPPAEFIAAVVEAIGPVDLAAYLASFADQADEPTYTDAEMDRMALDAEEIDTLSGHGGSDRVWDAYPESWHGRVIREIAESEAAIKAAEAPAPCCPAGEVAPCMGCVAAVAEPAAEPCPECGEEHDPDGESWSTWTDETRWTIVGDEPDEAAESLTSAMLAVGEVPPGRYTLAALVRASGAIFARWDTAAGDLIRDTFTGLADRIAESGATSVYEFERLDALDRMARSERAGWDAYHDGYRAAEGEALVFA